MGSFHTDMEVRAPTVGNIIILWPDIINRNTLIPEINECVCVSQSALDVKVCHLLFRQNRTCLHVCVCIILAQTYIPNCSCKVEMKRKHGLSVPLRPD